MNSKTRLCATSTLKVILVIAGVSFYTNSHADCQVLGNPSRSICSVDAYEVINHVANQPGGDARTPSAHTGVRQLLIYTRGQFGLKLAAVIDKFPRRSDVSVANEPDTEDSTHGRHRVSAGVFRGMLQTLRDYPENVVFDALQSPSANGQQFGNIRLRSGLVQTQ